MGSGLEEATTLHEDHGGLHICVPGGWEQGRGAFGGVAIGALARALMHVEEDDERALRTFSADLVAPLLPGRADVRVEVLRRGKRLSNIEARLLQDGNTVARGSGSLSTPRSADIPRIEPDPPVSPDWRELPVIPIGPPLSPVFAQRLEYRVSGPLPFSPSSEPVAQGFIREREPPARYDAPLLLAMLDVWWPGVFSVLEHRVRAATISFTAEVLCDPASVDPQVPLLHRGRVAAVHDGFQVEFRELWSQGRLVAANQQTMALG